MGTTLLAYMAHGGAMVDHGARGKGDGNLMLQYIQKSNMLCT